MATVDSILKKRSAYGENKIKIEKVKITEIPDPKGSDSAAPQSIIWQALLLAFLAIAGVVFSISDFGLSQLYLGSSAYPETISLLKDIAANRVDSANSPVEWARRKSLAEAELVDRLEKALSPNVDVREGNGSLGGIDPVTGIYSYGNTPAQPDIPADSRVSQVDDAATSTATSPTRTTETANFNGENSSIRGDELFDGLGADAVPASTDLINLVVLEPGDNAATVSTMLSWELHGAMMTYTGIFSGNEAYS
jgi:hypothetical protein